MLYSLFFPRCQLDALRQRSSSFSRSRAGTVARNVLQLSPPKGMAKGNTCSFAVTERPPRSQWLVDSHFAPARCSHSSSCSAGQVNMSPERQPCADMLPRHLRGRMLPALRIGAEGGIFRTGLFIGENHRAF